MSNPRLSAFNLPINPPKETKETIQDKEEREEVKARTTEKVGRLIMG